jgi:hypothetical protein
VEEKVKAQNWIGYYEYFLGHSIEKVGEVLGFR